MSASSSGLGHRPFTAKTGFQIPLRSPIIERSKHAKEDVIRVKLVEVICITCGKQMLRRPNDVRGNSKKGKAGPFCKSCTGKYGASIQYNKIRKLPPQPSVESEYYKNDKLIG